MRVNFYSSVEEGLFQHALRRELNKLGVPSESIYGVNLDNYRSASGALNRAITRAQMYPGFMAKCTYKWATSQVAPVSVVTTNPFFLPYMATKLLQSRKSKTVQLLWDLFPDALVLSDLLKRDSLGYSLMRRMTQSSLEHCEATVFLGDHLKSYAESVYGNANRAIVIPVGADGEPFADSPPRLDDSCPIPSLLYCGNMGRMHDSITISRALGKLAFSTVRLSAKFFGNGPGLRQVRETVGGGAGNISVEFGPGLDDVLWVSVMKKASMALVTMRFGAEKVVMPSKVYSALMAGQAIVAICPRNSDLGDLVDKYNCGWIVEPGKYDELAELLESIASDPHSLYIKRLNAYSAGHAHFSAKVLAKQWLNLFNSICDT